VTHDLTRFRAGRAKTHAISDRIQAGFQKLQQIFARLAFFALGFDESAAELAFQNAIHAPDFLLGAQVHAVVGKPRAGFLSVLTRRIGTTFNGALVSKALFALEEQFLPFTATLAAFGIKITSHVEVLLKYDVFWADGSRCAAPGSHP
jgi:hypothetical protein